MGDEREVGIQAMTSAILLFSSSISLSFFAIKAWQISSCLFVSPRAENKSSFNRVSADKLFSKCAFLSCMALKADMRTSVSECESLYCLKEAASLSMCLTWSSLILSSLLVCFKSFSNSFLWFLHWSFRHSLGDLVSICWSCFCFFLFDSLSLLSWVSKVVLFFFSSWSFFSNIEMLALSCCLEVTKLCSFDWRFSLSCCRLSTSVLSFSWSWFFLFRREETWDRSSCSVWREACKSALSLLMSDSSLFWWLFSWLLSLRLLLTTWFFSWFLFFLLEEEATVDGLKTLVEALLEFHLEGVEEQEVEREFGADPELEATTTQDSLLVTELFALKEEADSSWMTLLLLLLVNPLVMLLREDNFDLAADIICCCRNALSSKSMSLVCGFSWDDWCCCCLWVCWVLCMLMLLLRLSEEQLEELVEERGLASYSLDFDVWFGW